MTQDTSFVPLTGGCRCGQARFRLEATPIITHSCHCRLCQRTSGGIFNTVVMIETSQLTLVEGRTLDFTGVRSHRQIRCADCGCVLWSHRPDLGEVIAFVGVGTLDQGASLQPEAHFFIGSKHPWVTLPPGVPAFEEGGDPGKAGARERIMAALGERAVGLAPPH